MSHLRPQPHLEPVRRRSGAGAAARVCAASAAAALCITGTQRTAIDRCPHAGVHSRILKQWDVAPGPVALLGCALPPPLALCVSTSMQQSPAAHTWGSLVRRLGPTWGRRAWSVLTSSVGGKAVQTTTSAD